MKGTYIQSLEKLGSVLTNYGYQIILGLLVLVVALLAAQFVLKILMEKLSKMTIRHEWRRSISILAFILFNAAAVAVALGAAGYHGVNVFKLLIIAGLLAAAVHLLLKPFIPTLPFKEGNTVKSGGYLGKIETISLFNTRMRTFDGKTVWIPNKKILQDYLINYHFSPTRKIHLDVNISYDEELMRAKQTLETVMIEDSRVLTSPRPVVYVTQLKDDVVTLGGRCWVENFKYWTARCDLLEKTKLRFDAEGIAFALPQQVVHLKFPQGKQNPQMNMIAQDEEELE